MLILGIDTSTDIGAIGLVDSNQVLGEINLFLEHRQSERIIVNINHLLAETKYEVSELDGIAVTTGPGSFTGLRIGVTTAKTMAQFLEIPVIGISTLDVLAANIYSGDNKWILPVLDASRKRVYTALYRGQYSEKDLYKEAKKWPEAALALKNLFSKLKEEVNKSSVYLTGNAVKNYKNLFEDSGLNFKYPFRSQNISRGTLVAELGYNLLKNRDYTDQSRREDIFKLKPNYLKKAQAQIDR